MGNNAQTSYLQAFLERISKTESCPVEQNSGLAAKWKVSWFSSNHDVQI